MIRLYMWGVRRRDRSRSARRSRCRGRGGCWHGGGCRRRGRRRRGGGRRRGRLGVMRGEGEPEHVLVQPKCLPERSNSIRIEREYEQRVEAVAVFLDGIGEPALAPAVEADERAPVFGDPLAHPLQGGAQPLFIEVGSKNSDDLVSAHLARSLPLDCNRDSSVPIGTMLPGGPSRWSSARCFRGSRRAGRIRSRGATVSIFSSLRTHKLYHARDGFTREIGDAGGPAHALHGESKRHNVSVLDFVVPALETDHPALTKIGRASC